MTDDWRSKPRKPGGGRKPVAPGGVTPVTITLSASDVEALRTIDRNLSAAVRRLIQAIKGENSMLADRAGIVAGETPAEMVGKVREFCTASLPGETPAYVANQALMMWAGIAATQGIEDAESIFSANYGPGALPAIERRDKRLGS